jgi:cytidylate kinase
MPVIALTQEMGSLAKDVAERVAAVAGLTVMRNEVMENVAERMHVPPSLVRRVREGKAGLVERLTTDKQQFALYTEEEILHQAARGNVVLRGWGATRVLHAVPHVVRVRVTRSFDARVQWVMEDLETDSREQAEAEVRRSDNAHAARMNATYGVTWGDPLLYDLVINTDRVSVESAAQAILQLAERPEFQETPHSRSVLTGLALAAKVRAALKANDSTRHTDVQIDGREGGVTLSGIVVNEEERAEAERVANTVVGVGNVENRLHLMTVTRKFTYSKT